MMLHQTLTHQNGFYKVFLMILVEIENGHLHYIQLSKLFCILLVQRTSAPFSTHIQSLFKSGIPIRKSIFGTGYLKDSNFLDKCGQAFCRLLLSIVDTLQISFKILFCLPLFDLKLQDKLFLNLCQRKIIVEPKYDFFNRPLQFFIIHNRPENSNHIDRFMCFTCVQ